MGQVFLVVLCWERGCDGAVLSTFKKEFVYLRINLKIYDMLRIGEAHCPIHSEKGEWGM